MQQQEFWDLLNGIAHLTDLDEKHEQLGLKLNTLSPQDLIDFDRIFAQVEITLYDWHLWAAAYVIGGGCSDDSFMDFRATLICHGQTVVEKALQDPDSLADLAYIDPDDDPFYEGYQYLAADIYEDKTGKEMPDNGIVQPQDPSGEEWKDSELKILCPKLYEKYWQE